MTYEEFLTWADEDTLAEWVDGAVVLTSPANLRHQELVQFLYGMMALYGEIHALCTVIIAPFQMKLAASGREPDLSYLAAAHRDRLKDTYLDGPADLVVEVLSPESAGRDRGDKFYEYRDAG
ncbi:MAG TPA: Uma2 family endonuclease, partial [Ktedonobacterales bacterium]|nr:Uma2 family endonuclease [Ktedonobacterales bacterium]